MEIAKESSQIGELKVRSLDIYNSFEVLYRKREFSDRRIERFIPTFRARKYYHIAKESSQIGELKGASTEVSFSVNCNYRKREFSDRRIERGSYALQPFLRGLSIAKESSQIGELKGQRHAISLGNERQIAKESSQIGELKVLLLVGLKPA